MLRRRERIPLLEGEDLVFELREHCFTLIWPAIILVVTTGISAFLAGTVPDTGAQTTLRLIIGATAGAIVLRWSVWPFLSWYAHSWVLTSRRLLVRHGVFSRRGLDVPLDRVIGSSASRTLLQRMFRSGRLTISTASPAGDLVIENTPMLAEVQKVVAAAVANSGPTAIRPSGLTSPAFPPAPPASPHQPFPPQQFPASS
ncbi:PH domain-containing protein [Sporichthya polymorpha]|uniref:PH domain-containing protein n=1 Tax=Sporichthya polymorpha TaxID=35751 RepID=UPI00037F1E20|nr:PH domain-containing protein [Sporichthya polymorpha]